MSDSAEDHQYKDEPVTRLEDLQNQCKLRGIKFHHKNTEDTLLELLRAANEKENPVVAKKKSEMTAVEKRQAMRNKCLKLKRVMITCNDPMKIKYRGEIFQAANASVAAIRKFCPFGNTNGWYMPQILLNVIDEKQFRRANTDERDPMSGGLTKAYNITYLDDLTPEEFGALRHQQALRKAQLSM